MGKFPASEPLRDISHHSLAVERVTIHEVDDRTSSSISLYIFNIGQVGAIMLRWD
jgi:hypothetical protein